MGALGSPGVMKALNRLAGAHGYERGARPGLEVQIERARQFDQGRNRQVRSVFDPGDRIGLSNFGRSRPRPQRH